MAQTITEQVKYFQIDGGDTVLELEGKRWKRWDTRDGVVDTHVPWSASDPRLTEITREEAISLMK